MILCVKQLKVVFSTFFSRVIPVFTCTTPVYPTVFSLYLRNVCMLGFSLVVEIVLVKWIVIDMYRF